MTYVYIKQKEGPGCYLYTVGCYDPSGQWNPESDHETREDAADRVNYLNGAGAVSAKELTDRVSQATLDGYDAGFRAGEISGFDRASRVAVEAMKA